MKPILALDVDGPINTFGTQRNDEVYECWANEVPLRIPHQVPELLRSLAEHYEIVWYTSWKQTANRWISPIVGLPQNLRVIDFDRYSTPKIGESRKFRGLLGWLKEDLVAAVVDDEIGVDMTRWAKRRSSPVLLIEIDPRLGLQRKDTDKLIKFAEQHS